MALLTPNLLPGNLNRIQKDHVSRHAFGRMTALNFGLLSYTFHIQKDRELFAKDNSV